MTSKNKSRQKYTGRRQRRLEERKLKKRFLIVCEGKKTEPNYFHKFPVPKDVIEIVHTDHNTDGVVRQAIESMEEGNYDQVWCVFDRDSFPAEHFNRAFQFAKKHSIQIAYSNEAFELWYLLHFEYYQTGISRQDYIGLLRKHLGGTYAKNNRYMYEKLLPHQPQAIKNAQRLLDQYTPPNPEKDNPSTTVHILVQELNKFRRE